MSAEPRNIPIQQGSRAEGGEESQLDTLLGEIEQLASMVRDTAEQRANQAAEAARAGADRMRDAVRQQPWLVLGLAGAVGAALAIAVVRPRSRSGMSRRLQPLTQYFPDDIGTSLRDAGRAGVQSAQSLGTRLEQVAEAIARFDPQQASSHPIVAALTRWAQSLRS